MTSGIIIRHWKPASIIKLVSLVILLLMLLSACNAIGAQVEYKAGPLEVTVDTFGEIQFALKPEANIPTPLGTFSVGLIANPNEYFNKEDILIVRLNCEDHFYDLHGQDFHVEFKPGYYNKVDLSKIRNNILLELRTKDSTFLGECPQSVTVIPKTDGSETEDQWAMRNPSLAFKWEQLESGLTTIPHCFDSDAPYPCNQVEGTTFGKFRFTNMLHDTILKLSHNHPRDHGCISDWSTADPFRFEYENTVMPSESYTFYCFEDVSAAEKLPCIDIQIYPSGDLARICGGQK